MKIIISPFSKPLKNGWMNPKNYPWWPELVSMLRAEGHTIIQIGTKDEVDIGCDEKKDGLKLSELEKLVMECDTWFSSDNFFHHFCDNLGKNGFAIFGTSDPTIFGRRNNINILLSRKNLRKDQFNKWDDVQYNAKVFPKPKEVMIRFNNSIDFIKRMSKKKEKEKCKTLK